MSAQHQIIKTIRPLKNFLVVSHYHPDGDALGSTLAFGSALKKLNKNVVMYNRDPVPHNLQFLPGSKRLTQDFPKKRFDCAVMLDCAQPKRISAEFAAAVEAKQFGKILCIDHHLLDHEIGDVDWVDHGAASTGCLVWELLKKMKLHTLPHIANLIYCTLTVDTGSFRYSNTTPEVFRLAAELVKRGANPWEVASNLEESNPRNRFELLQLALSSLHVDFDGQYASMDITQAMLKEVQGHEGLSDEFANYPRSIAGVEVSALFREMEDGRIKVSLRSKKKVDVSKITKLFGGGGHKHAAGCVIHADLASAKRRVAQKVRKCVNT